MYYMPTISVRISDEERKKLLKLGPLSETVREAIEMYVNDAKKREALRELKEFQRAHPVRITSEEIVRIIREGRDH